MRHLELIEGAPAVPRPDLTVAEAEALQAAELAVVTRVPGNLAWQVAAGTKVGVARIDDLQVTVRPKVPIERLIFLMGYAQQPRFWRDQSVLLDVEADLADALAHAFTRYARKGLDQGLLQGYRHIDDSLPVLRGRLRVADQISHRFGVGLPLEVSYDEFTTDIAENQLLLAATERLLRMPGVGPDMRPGLQRIRLKLAAVSPLPRGMKPPTWIPSRLNARYQPALALADLILAGDSFEQRLGQTTMSGFVLDMWKIYEDFVCVALREALRTYGGESHLQYRTHLDEAHRVALRPDFVWARRGVPAIVADAKYKSEKYDGFPNADVYQLLAYCTRLGLRDGHLIYAKGNEVAAAHDIEGADVRVHCHALELDQPPGVLLNQVEGLVQKIRRCAEGDFIDDRTHAHRSAV